MFVLCGKFLVANDYGPPVIEDDASGKTRANHWLNREESFLIARPAGRIPPTRRLPLSFVILNSHDMDT